METIIESDAIIARINDEIAPIVAKATEVAVISDAQSENRAVEFLSQVKRRFKLVDEQRTFAVKPLNDHVKALNERFKITLGPLADAERIVKDAMIEYRKSVEFKEAEERRLSLEQEAHLAVKQGDTAGLVKIADAHALASAAAPKTIESMSGKAHFREVWKFEIEDPTLIPAAFLMPNEKAIKEAIETGEKIPGVKSYTEKVPVIR